jgi:hypothetical protein
MLVELAGMSARRIAAVLNERKVATPGLRIEMQRLRRKTPDGPSFPRAGPRLLTKTLT